MWVKYFMLGHRCIPLTLALSVQIRDHRYSSLIFAFWEVRRFPTAVQLIGSGPNTRQDIPHPHQVIIYLFQIADLGSILCAGSRRLPIDHGTSVAILGLDSAVDLTMSRFTSRLCFYICFCFLFLSVISDYSIEKPRMST